MLGLTEQQAAEQLNLDVAVVEALERDDFAALGAPVFAKGHLRRYGAMLGVVEDELLTAYERAGAQPEAPTLVPRARQEMMPVRGRPKWPWVVGGALAFVLAAGLAAYVSEHGLNWSTEAGDTVGLQPAAGSGVVDAQGTDAGPAGAAPSAIDTMADASAQPTAAAAAAVEPLARPVPPGHVSISLAFAADSWAEVYDASGQAVLYDLGRAGTQRSIAAAAPLSVTIGNAPGVTLAVNGRPAVLPVVPGGGTVARFRIEADGTVR
jgi:cytoskeleton protein RodZ